jgi:Multiple myeloma tumor-associated
VGLNPQIPPIKPDTVLWKASSTVVNADSTQRSFYSVKKMGRPGDLFGPPIREASARGGSGRFNWDDVKKDEKFRDTYLGHSLRAPVGRWQKGKDLTWYAKATPTNATDEKARQKEDRLAEIRKIKEAEEEALAEALGFKVQRKVKTEGVSQEELASALKDEDVEVERAQGLGFGKFDPKLMRLIVV